MSDNAVLLEEAAIEEIAVIGMAGRFPGARNVEEFWQNLRNGVDSIHRFTDQELESLGIDGTVLNDPHYVRAKAAIDHPDFFDASFFGFSPREAEIIDPQQRLFLETAWEALEKAGYDGETYPGMIGVFSGASMNHYIFNVYSEAETNDPADDYQKLLGIEKDFLATRVSHNLNLKGPSLTVQTGCSTSLITVQLACQSLLNYQCSMALAGGVSLNLRQKGGYFYHDGGIPSPDGYCRAFDAKAQGTVLGEGVGVVVLKRLSEALADGDTIHAVIKGIATNNDGAMKVSFTAPSVDGQAEVIAMAQALSDVAPESISYIEAHGTGTSLGDPIEIAALTQVFRAGTDKKGFCGIGSVKTNVGHLDVAAGVTGLIKTVLALEHKEIPPSLYFEEPNPNIDFQNSPFYVNSKLSEWKTDGFPRRAGVSSFGIGGTNAHAVLEEAPVVQPSGKSRPWQLLLLSAQTNTALEKMTANLVEHLRQNPHLDFPDVAYTFQVGRKVMDYRRMLVCQSLDDAVTALNTVNPGRVMTTFQEPMNRDVVFMFSGQGSQYVNMGLELYETEPTFRRSVDMCSEILQPHLSLDLRHILYPDEGNIDEFAEQLEQTLIAQPALFTVEYALAKLLISWGVRPAALVGHSIGEYVAACLAGVFSLEDGLSLVSTRGRLMQELPGGSMLAVPLSEKEIQPYLNKKLSLSAVNSPSFCVVSGPKEAIEDLEEQLAERNVNCRHLHTSHAFHSRMMAPILEEFIEQAKLVDFNPPEIPIVSTVTGTWITSDEIMTPGYWARNLRQTVRFSDCVQELLQEPNRIFLEVGPGQTLSTLARQHLNESKEQIVLSSIRHPKENQSDIGFILNTLGRLWLAGIRPDWSGFYQDERRRRLPLPTYPFERQRYWIEVQQPLKAPKTGQRSPNKKADLSEWFYVPSWKRRPLLKPQDGKAISGQKLCWLVFLDKCGWGAKLAGHLKQEAQQVVTVTVGEQFSQVNEEHYTINPKEQEDYHRLLKELRSAELVPERIVHLWCLTNTEQTSSDSRLFEVAQDLGFNSLLFLTQAIGDQFSRQSMQISVISNNLHEVTGEEVLFPEKAILLGPCRVMPKEYPTIQCTSVDIVLPKEDSQQEEELQEFLLEELTAPTSDATVAYRGKHRWVQTFETVRLEKAADLESRLRDYGVYLVTGGLGGIGLALAEYLAQTVRAKLVLTARSSLPPRTEWKQWLESHDEKDTVSQNILKVQSMEELGAEALVLSADVTDKVQMEAAIAQTYERFGQIHGVIHSAGIAGGGVMQLKTVEAAKDVLAPKIQGAVVLGELLNGANLDFFVLCSSLDSFLGTVGQVDYCAANAFLDAYAQQQNGERNTISINWCTWQEVGMAVNTEVPFDLKAEREENLNLGIRSAEGKEAFGRILSNSFPQVVVSTQDFLSLIEQTNQLPGPCSLAEKVEPRIVKPAYARPNLSSVYVAPGNPSEQTIAEIWQELLKIDKVGIHDNFFDLGGHSLLATKVIARLKDAFPVEFTMASLFESPTVHSLSEMILESEQGSPSFIESRDRGQKRKEKRMQRTKSGKRSQFHEKLASM